MKGGVLSCRHFPPAEVAIQESPPDLWLRPSEFLPKFHMIFTAAHLLFTTNTVGSALGCVRTAQVEVI